MNLVQLRPWALLLVATGIVTPVRACLDGYGPAKGKNFKQLKQQTKYFAHASSKKLAAQPAKVRIDGALPDFALRDLFGRPFTARTFQGKMPLFVLADTQCPCVQAVEMRIRDLGSRYKGQGLQPVYVFSKPDEKAMSVYSFMMTHKIRYPALLDGKQKLLKILDGQCSSEVYLFDKNSRLRYHGRVDDSTFDPKSVKSKDLEKAVVALTQGKKVPKPEVPAMGCSIPRL